MRKYFSVFVALTIGVFLLGSCSTTDSKSTPVTPITETTRAIDTNSVKDKLPSTDKPTVKEPTVSKMGILDYYYSIPLKYLSFKSNDGTSSPLFPSDSKDKRKAAIKNLDEKNYYLEISPLDADGAFGTMAVFIKPNGDHVIAVESRICDAYCNNESLHFYQLKDGKWSDVTDQVMPDLEEIYNQAHDLSQNFQTNSGVSEGDRITSILFKLPKTGTTITVYDSALDDLDFFKLVWQGGVFVTKQVTH